MKNYARMGKSPGRPAFRTPALYRANKPIKAAIEKAIADRAAHPGKKML